MGATDEDVARLREHPVGLLIHASRLTHLFGDRDAQLVDEVEHGRLFEDDLAGHRDLTRVHRERLKPLNEELDVQRSPSSAGAIVP